MRQVFEAISSGEDDQVYLDTLQSINDSIEDKADGYMRIIKNLEGDNEALDKEIKRLQARKKTNANGIKRMKESLQLAMEETNKLAFKTSLFSYGIQNNAPSLDNLDMGKIPKNTL
ncbi:Gam-like end protection [Staphylococcus phage S-CoN_Ph27]|nr:Gam-like end protection [Staphylococcus phage S-CoN_Ph27]